MRLMKVLSNATDVSYYELLVETEQEAVYASQKDIRGRWIHAQLLSRTESQRLRMMIIVESGGWAECLLDPVHDSQLANLVPELLEQARNNPSTVEARTDSYAIPFRGLEIFDLRYQRMDDDARVEIFTDNLDRMSMSEYVTPLGLWLHERADYRYFVSSNQSAHHERSTHFSLRCEAMLTGNSKQVDKLQMMSRRIADVGSRPIGAELVQRLQMQLEKRPFQNNLPFLLEPSVVSEIIRSMLPAFDGERIEQGISFLCGFEGQQIASPVLHIVDDASLPNGIVSRGFDGFGVSSQLLTLVCEGVFQDSYTSLRRSRANGKRPSGHYNMAGQLWPGNISLKEGRRSRNMIASDIGPLVCLTDIDGSLSINQSTGALLMRAHASHVSQETIEYVGLVKLECHVFDLLKAIKEVASDHSRHGDVDTSSWLLDSLPFQPE
ncbi:MAG: metallopeptidase TldD-related protein [Myxococcota bacterium]